jgi:UDP-2-acetamido-3-amino-2,3-dideoxy-glucuronate N-acetyltransferase
MDYFKHALAVVETQQVGKGTRIWAFAHILPGAKIGAECNICDHTFIESDVEIGDRVTIKCGVFVWDGVRLEDDVFVGPNATFTNDKLPRSGVHNKPLITTVKEGASLGANSTIMPGITIGARALVGAGAVVTRDVPPWAIVTGNPARITGYVGAGYAGAGHSGSETAQTAAPGSATVPAKLGAYPSRVEGVTIHRLPLIPDLRGSLTAGQNLPFEIKRYFMVFDVPSREVRGEHAHRECHQFLVCARGECHVIADDGRQREEIVLDSPSIGVHLAPMVWAAEYRYSADAVLLVLASDVYKSEDYIRDYSEFCALKNTSHG